MAARLWFFVAFVSGSTLLALACLPSIAEPLACPPPPAGSALCPATGPQPSAQVPTPKDAPVPSAACSERLLSCVARNTACVCREGSCPSRASSCFPEGDCPPAVLRRTPAAKCNTQITATVAGDIRCACSCASCALACDGRGVLLGAGARLRIRSTEPLSSPKAGSGLVIRMRGRGSMLVGLPSEGVPPDGPSAPPIEVARDDYGDSIFELGKTQLPTNTLDLAVNSGEIEVDCVIPWTQ